MNTLFAVLAGVATLIALGLLYWRWRVKRELAVMAATRHLGCGSVASEPAGSAVSVQGTLRVRSPLVAEFSQKPCAYFIAEIEREEVYYERDSQGRQERRTRTTTVYTNMKYGQCLIEDASGKVGIDFEGAKVEAVQTINQPNAAPPGGAPGGVVGGILSALSNASYTRKEHILPADIPVFLLGEVQQGGLIGKPAKGSSNKLFVISHKSEEQRVKDLGRTAWWLTLFVVLLFAIAVALLIWGGVKGG
jgi:E3 ubiquitin ligase